MRRERAERLEKLSLEVEDAAYTVGETCEAWRGAKAGRAGCEGPMYREPLDPAKLEAKLARDIERFQRLAKRLK